MPRDSKVYLEDILEAIRRIQSYLSGLEWKVASQYPKTFDAIVRNLEIIGEAAKNLSAAFKKSHPTIEWRKISGFRDILAHQYFGIDESIIGDVIKNKLPQLKEVARDSIQKGSASDMLEPPNAREIHALYKAGGPKTKTKAIKTKRGRSKR